MRFFFFFTFSFIIYNFLFSQQIQERYQIGVWGSIQKQFDIKYSKKRTCIDNEYIQTYHDLLGKWHYITNKKKLIELLNIYGSEEQNFYSINNLIADKIIKPNDYFITFSKSQITKLKEEGISKLCINTSSKEYIWPLMSTHISSGVGPRWGKKHSGIDLPAIVDTHIVSATTGVVQYSGYFSTYGKVIIIKESNYFYLYAHLNKTYVKNGDIIRKGQTIGRTGNSGISTGPHLHFEIRYQKMILDPEQFLSNFDEHMNLLAKHERQLTQKISFLGK